MLWLEDENGAQAPSLWNEENDPNLTNDNQKSIGQRIEEANEELILCSEEAATCPIHSREESLDDCEECEILKEYVRTFQTHSCTFTCLKKRNLSRYQKKKVSEKVMRIWQQT